MWLSEKRDGRDAGCGSAAVGIVTIGGAKPSVLVEGEVRAADVVSLGSAWLPKAGDEVLLIRSPDGENIVIGKVGAEPPTEAENGEVYITTGNGGLIRLKNNGDIELSGTVIISGTTKIEGELLINGTAYEPGT